MSGSGRATRAALVNIDGTLVDSNYQHALAWFRAMRRHGITCEIRVLHHLVGMGGDQLVTAAAGEDVERRHGDALREAEAAIFREMIDEVTVLPGAGGCWRRWPSAPGRWCSRAPRSRTMPSTTST